MYDFVVVGGGSAGCAVAGRLARENSGKILILESGPWDKNPLIHIPAGFTKLLDTKYLYHYETAPQAHLDGKPRVLPQGHVFGGGSSVNAAIYIRGQKRDYDEWEKLGAKGWSYKDVLPYFKRAEDNDRLSNEYHGVGGPLGVSDLRQIAEISRAFVQSCQEYGIPFNEDFNGAQQRGVGFNQTTTRNVKRCSAAVGYIHPILKDGSVEVKTKCDVTRILFEGTKAVGVEYVENGKTKTVHAASEVIISAGAVQTPKLLMLSGIGPEAELKRHGIDVFLKAEGIGQNLQDHLEFPAIRYCTGKYGYYGQDKFFKAIKNGLQYMMFKTGPVASNVTEACCFINVDDMNADPNIQMHFVPIVFLDMGSETISRAGATINATVVKPKSVGNLTLKSANPKDDPIMDPKYLSDPDDMRVSLKGLEMAREILAQKSFSKYVESTEAIPGERMRDKAQLENFIRERGKTIYHPVGTVKMGADKMSPVDPELRLKGVENLRIVDNSVMPNLISGNTNATAIMIGERAADFIRGTPLQG